MKKLISRLVFFVFVLAVSQFIQPKKNEGSLNDEFFIKETNTPLEVKKILEKSCYDCHSNKTRYPSYSNITPLNFWIANHINQGKKYLNFSQWDKYNKYQKATSLDKMYKEVKYRKMPLKTYILKHPEANLSKEQIRLVTDWLNSLKK